MPKKNSDHDALDVSGCVRTGGGTGRSSSQYWLWNGWSMAQIHHDPPALVCSVNTQWWWEHQGGQVEKLSKSHHKHPWRPLSWTSCLPAWAWGWQGVVWSRYLVIFLPLCCRNNMMLYRPSKIYIRKKCPLSLTKPTAAFNLISIIHLHTNMYLMYLVYAW